MNTEIKFRGWSIEGKKWLYGGMLFFKDGTAIMPDREENDKMITSPVDPKSIGQFTSIVDNAEFEIYAGDIVDDDGDLYEIKFGHYFHNHCETVGFYFSDGHPFGKAINRIGFKVVGNIYQNPELLS